MIGRRGGIASGLLMLASAVFCLFLLAEGLARLLPGPERMLQGWMHENLGWVHCDGGRALVRGTNG